MSFMPPCVQRYVIVL